MREVSVFGRDHDLCKTLVGASDHLAQLCLHVGDFFSRDVYHQGVLLDVMWAGKRIRPNGFSGW